MKFIIDVAQGEEDFLLKLLESLDIVSAIEKIDEIKNTINQEQAQILKERIAKLNSGEMRARSWEELKRDLNIEEDLFKYLSQFESLGRSSYTECIKHNFRSYGFTR